MLYEEAPEELINALKKNARNYIKGKNFTTSKNNLDLAQRIVVATPEAVLAAVVGGLSDLTKGTLFKTLESILNEFIGSIDQQYRPMKNGSRKDRAENIRLAITQLQLPQLQTEVEGAYARDQAMLLDSDERQAPLNTIAELRAENRSLREQVALIEGATRCATSRRHANETLKRAEVVNLVHRVECPLFGGEKLSPAYSLGNDYRVPKNFARTLNDHTVIAAYLNPEVSREGFKSAISQALTRQLRNSSFSPARSKNTQTFYDELCRRDNVELPENGSSSRSPSVDGAPGKQ